MTMSSVQLNGGYRYDQAITAEEANQIPEWLREIAHKKATDINNLVTGCLEHLVHWFLMTCTCAYPAYQRFYQKEIHLDRCRHTTTFQPLDGGLTEAKLTNCTHEIVASVIFVDHPIPSQRNNRIFLNDIEVIFSAKREEPVFLNGYGAPPMLAIWINEVPNNPDQLKISQMIPGLWRSGGEKEWHVDMRKLYYLQSSPEQPPQLVYVPEEVIATIEDSSYLFPLQSIANG